MNIFYKENAHKWEEDFLFNDIFNKTNFKYKIDFIVLPSNLELLNIYCNKNNILIINSCTTPDEAINIINIINPIIIFYIGDEIGNGHRYYQLENKTKLFFHQYNHKHISYGKNNFQLPLGYIKYYLSTQSTQSSIDINIPEIKNRHYECSFIGTIKSDRINMCNLFKTNFKKTIIKTGNTDWSDPLKQQTSPEELFNIYSNSIFVINGRGNISLDCFRIYEAIVAGSIPVIVGNTDEIKITFNYNNCQPKMVIGNSWQNAVDICKDLLKQPEKLQEMQNFNKNWWKLQIYDIQNKINNILDN